MIRPQPRVSALLRQQTPKIGRVAKLRLDINENTVGWPAEVVGRLLSEITPGALSAYPETHALYDKIARRHGVSADHVLVGAGSEMVIRYLFEAFLGPGADLVILDPSFAMFDVYGRLYGANIVWVPFDERLNIDVDQILAAITPSVGLVAIANPNNPTGTVIAERDLIRVVEHASAVGCVALIDEAYFYFCPETMAAHVTSFDNLVVTRTFSKAFALAGARLGYAIGAPAVIATAQRVQPIDHASTFAVKLGEYAIEHEELAWNYAREVEAGKAHLVASLREMGIPVVSGHANFVLADFGTDRDWITSQLQERILLGTSVRLRFPNHYVKITVGPPAQMEVLLDALRPLLPAVLEQAGRSKEHG